MTADILQFFPPNQPAQQLEGLYLSHNIRQYISDETPPFVYANYIVSVDGRISIPNTSGDGQTVPKDTANGRDWRLFQELVAQSDLIVSSGRYLREWAEGNAQEILEVNNPKFTDLRRWRKNQGLKPHPDIAIISGSLNFPIPDVLTASGRQVVVFTTEDAPKENIERIESKAGQVFIVGQSTVDGKQMLEQISSLGYKAVYNATGPKVMHLLFEAGVVNRLYLTIAHRVLGGMPFSSIVEGSLFETAVNLQLNTLYFDQTALDGLGQLFFSYDIESKISS